MDFDSRERNPKVGPETITVAQLAKRLQIGRGTAYKLTQTPGFPVVRLGSAIRIPVRLLDEWLSAAAK